MRPILLIPILVVIACAIGMVACRAVGADPHVREMIAAGMTGLLAGELAAVPLLLARGGNQGSVAQAALVGTVIHLFVSVAIAGVILLAHLLGTAYVYWLFGMYWVTLVALVIAFVRAVRSAPVTGAPVNK